MSFLSGLPAVGTYVIVAIVMIFALSVILLFYTYARYKIICRKVPEIPTRNNFLRFVLADFAEAYRIHGDGTNTPAVVANGINTKLSGLLFCERFLNNAVSLFVTLGLFGTFLGLSLSVSSLTELITFSNSSEWLSVLDSVGGGLMSALSGMGVAFYTSLVGVACSIILTILRSIFSPAAEREKLETRIELWLDHNVAPTLPTEAVKDEAVLVNNMIDALEKTAESVDTSMKSATEDLRRTIYATRDLLVAFDKTVNNFNSGARDFNEFNYNLRGTVERMDISLRDVVSSMNDASRNINRSVNK